MILQALYQLAEKESLMADPDYEPKLVAWLVRVSKDGKLLGIVGTHYIPPQEQAKKKPNPRPKQFRVPRQPTGRSGTKAPACFLVDNAKYVFGLPTKGKDFSAEEGKQKAGWFRELVQRCADETSDEAVVAVEILLDAVASGRQQVELPAGCKSNDLFAFVYTPDMDKLVHDRSNVKEYWRRLRSQESATEAVAKQCLVSGKPMGDVGLFPLIENVPGASPSRIGLVSFNKNAFESYGWKGNQNAPVSRDAAETCATALNRLLHPAYPGPLHSEQTLPKRNLRLSSDTAVCFWSANESGDEFCSVFSGLLEANPEQVGALYRSIWRGKPIQIDAPSAFYALTLTGTQGRVIVRDWLESTVEKAASNLAIHFRDLEIVRNIPKPKARDLPPQMPMSLLLRSITPDGDSEKIPAPLVGELVEAALKGTPYPFSILQRALERTRAEMGREEWDDLNRRDARAAIIKAVLNRRKRFFPQTTNYEEVQSQMDPTNASEGYTLGSLLAVLERLQQEALNNVNASVVDRYFSAASASPKAVFVRLLKNARHHVRKASDDPQRGGMVFLLDRLVDEMADRFDPKNNGFPAFLNLEQQGLFVLGYHQMRKWLWMTSEERVVWENVYPSAPRAYLWKTAKSQDVNQ